MQADCQKKSLTVHIDEVISLLLCRRFTYEIDTGEPSPAELPREAEALLPQGEPRTLKVTLEREGYTLILTATAHRVTEDGIYQLALFDGNPDTPPAAVRRRARAEAFLLSAMLDLTLEREPAPRPLHILYFERGSGKASTVTETPAPRDITDFLRRACRITDTYAPVVIEGMGIRRPSMAALKFPFSERRAGQGELMQAVYRAIRRGTRLYAAAPTGIGKTMSVLYPAVRALGEGHTDKIFYLTPKNTVARAAVSAVTHLSEQGAYIRAVRLYAKETICQKGVLCREDKTACRCHARSEAAYDRAVAELRCLPREHPVITMPDLLRVATKHGVCPHELAFCYSEIADIVIGDYHYLFDPHIRIRRYFTGGGDYTFLIDEAHNLVERGRDMYSAALTDTDLAAFREWTRAFCINLDGIAEKAHERFVKDLNTVLAEAMHSDGQGGKCAYLYQKALPEDLLDVLMRLTARAEDELAKHRINEEQLYPFFRLLSPIRRFVRCAEAHDGDCTAICTYEAGTFTLKSYCINPAARLAACMDKGRAAVLFSATMEPLHYYESVLGADRHSDSLSLPSPFPEENLAVAVMDGISLRYLDRADTMHEIISAILTTVRAKSGNYLVFCPSFDYLDTLEKEVRRAAPELQTVTQTRGMSHENRKAFLDRFGRNPTATTVGFAVMGGVFSESVDLTGDRLIGSIVIGVGLPTPTVEREACAAYYDEKCDSGREYAYLYPGMNRVWQAAGRVIRTEQDKGVLLLIDDRFREPFYRAMIPPHLRHTLRFVGNSPALAALLHRFWQN